MTPVKCLLQVVETGAALTWAFFAFPTRHFDEKTPILQASHAHTITHCETGTCLQLGHHMAVSWIVLRLALYTAALCCNIFFPVTANAHMLHGLL